MGGAQHRGYPFAVGIQGGAPGARGLLCTQWFAKACGVLLPGAVPPAGFTGIRHEDHRAHYTVGQCLGVSVGVVCL
ncbi:Uncharacterised protein [Mycobacteroides abscessus subsp. abscessus]|nr:Uncharacterised protein [Mycobacteroides abscessus subsp. abscessus]